MLYRKNQKQLEPRRLPLWAYLLGVFALLVVWQGALRKWVVPQLSTFLYVAKDVVLVGVLLLLGRQRKLQLAPPLRRTLLPVLWGGFAFIVVLQSANFNVPSLAVGVLGVKSYLLYTTLLIVVPMALDRLQSPGRLVTAALLLSIFPVLLIGLYQYSQPVGSWINRYVASEAQVVGVLSYPRITGTFSYIGGMSAFLVFSLFLGMAMLLAGLRYAYTWYKLFGGALLVLSLVVAPMNGSRSVVLGFLLPLPFVLPMVLRGRHKKTVILGLAVLFLTIGGLVTIGGGATRGWEAFEYRVENASDSGTRIQSMLYDPIRKVEVGGLLGYGTGTTHQAASAVSESGSVSIDGVNYEGELGRVLIELGVLGALFFVGIKAWLAWAAWQVLRRAATAGETIVGVLTFCFLFLNLGAGEKIVFNHVNSALYWICAGGMVWVWSRQEYAISKRQLVRE